MTETIAQTTFQYMKNESGLSNVRYCDTDPNPVFHYCWANDGKQITQLTTCRGWMMDAIFGTIHNAEGQGIWRKCNGLVNLTKAQPVIAAQKGKLEPLIPQFEDFFHQMEARLGFEPTVFNKAQNVNKCDVYLIDGDVKWIHSPFLLSFYLFCMRTVAPFYHTIGENVDASLAKFFNEDRSNFYCSYGGDYNDDYGDDYGDGDYDDRNEFGISVSDYHDFYSSYNFICRVLKYGIDPFFYPKTVDNFPCPYIKHPHPNGYRSQIFSPHEFGMYATASGRGYMDVDAIKYVHRFDTEKAIEDWIKKSKDKVSSPKTKSMKKALCAPKAKPAPKKKLTVKRKNKTVLNV